MRVLFLTYNVTGQSNYLRAQGLACALASRGYDLTLISAPAQAQSHSRSSLTPVGSGTLHHITTKSLGSQRWRNSGLSVSESLNRASLLRQSEHTLGPFDLVHGFGHRPTVSWVGQRLARKRGIPYIADWCDLFGVAGIAEEREQLSRWVLGTFDSWLERHTYRRADAATVISTALQKRMNSLAPEVPVTRVFPGGIARAQETNRQSVRDSLGISSDAPVVLHISRNHQDVGLLLETVLDIAVRLPICHFLIVGPKPPGLERIATEDGFADRCHMVGLVPHNEVPQLLAASDLALLPYPPSVKNECRFPCSMAEYASARLPTVTQPTGDLPSLGEGKSGALFVDASPSAMANAAIAILNDPKMASDLAQQAKSVAVNQLDWSVGAQAVADLYQRMVPSKARSRRLAAIQGA